MNRCPTHGVSRALAGMRSRTAAAARNCRAVPPLSPRTVWKQNWAPIPGVSDPLGLRQTPKSASPIGPQANTAGPGTVPPAQETGSWPRCTPRFLGELVSGIDA